MLELHFLQSANMAAKFQPRFFVFISFLVVFPVVNLAQFSDYVCNNEKKLLETCSTYAVLRASSYYPSLSSISSNFSLARSDLGFLDSVDLLPEGQNVLIPIQCGCSNGGVFEAEVRKSIKKGESFDRISESLEGLTTCKAIRERNPNLGEGISVLVPLKCACPSPADSGEFLVSYPVKEGDTVVQLAAEFGVSVETLVSANGRYSRTGFGDNLVPMSTILIPMREEAAVGKLQERPAESIRVRRRRRRKRRLRMWMIGVGLVGFVACIGAGVAFFFTHRRKSREENLTKTKPPDAADLEMQQLSLSIRTTSDKKVSFEGSQYNFDDHAYTTTPNKARFESYTFEELQKATEEFSSSNLIEDSVFQGRLKGKNLAIKRVASDAMSKIDCQVFQDRVHHHPNIIRLLGSCLMDGPDSYLVLEYATNGSLKDWIHGGLAIKSHFIASCSCFLTWNQRIRICLDVATALQHMHHIMTPTYVHRNIKSRNIFLDEDFTAKIGNFGMAMLAEEDKKESSKGYLAPEYVSQGTISPSVDIFAYGVVLLEVLSGKPPVARDEDKEEGEVLKLSDEIKRVLKTEDAEELRGWIDGALGESYSFDGAVTLANMARACVEDDASSRPSAGEVVEKLLRMVEELPEGDEYRGIGESSCKPLVKAIV